ncbi:hypothetical protein [Streptomyces alkaliterrae]|uniref:Peptidase inhibitor family I36 protein n=1 Tax=Streptomyces alkaliterrae TaxID=2213162 RepID=A0A5P0YRT2_9ACTN|nr:hypothetical protein [Streptomyces alkaliterrae]MBB1256650.1 hypothetical protein [Streptomyces alkaliterrae]MBB1260638.1 hypothetical protein [Streptomyces alkaliterrae]MQS02590.1 hypothetical protein [Streptomyces alkaliterrae]
MRKRTTGVAAVVGGLVLAAGALSATSTAATAAESTDRIGVQSCYGSAKSYTKPAGQHYYPSGYPGGTWLTATTNCNDINIRPNSDRYVKVCFNPSSGSPYCQSSNTWAPSGKWTVVATNVRSGTKFKFRFWSDGRATGSWAG